MKYEYTDNKRKKTHIISIYKCCELRKKNYERNKHYENLLQFVF